MQAKEIEREVAMSIYRKQQEETEAMLRRVLGRYGEPDRPLEELRKDLAKELKGLSVSRLVMEARR